MKIVKLTAENFMRLVAVEISPQGNAIMITGKNAAGKSSVLDAIMSALCGKRYQPEKPIRDGQDHAEVVVETENFIIKRTFTAKGGGTVTVSNAEGMKASSPQKMLDKLVGEIAFEPMEFFKDGKDVKKQREQRAMLMQLVGLDFTDIDKKIKAVKAERSAVKTSKETYDFEAGQIPEMPDVGDELVSMDELTTKLRIATKHNEKQVELQGAIDDGQRLLTSYMEKLDASIGAITALKKQLTFAEQQKANNQEEIAKIEAKLDGLAGQMEPLIDLDAINRSIGLVEQSNNLVRDKLRRTELVKKSADKSREFAALGKKMKTLDAQKAARLGAAKMPIEKLSVDENTILYNNIPLSQVNESMQLQIAVAISMALNPKLKVILMKGNDLDAENLEAVCTMARDKDYQVWIEKVSDDKSNKTGFIIEDGSVVPADGEGTLFEEKAQG
jgi:chromosome segregation ATPase